MTVVTTCDLAVTLILHGREVTGIVVDVAKAGSDTSSYAVELGEALGVDVTAKVPDGV